MEGTYYLATVHRAENTDDLRRLTAIVEAFEQLARAARVILPPHPRTKAALEHSGRYNRLEAAVTLCGPLGYVDMARPLMSAQAMVTDSGGAQKEPFFFGVPAFIMRTETDWTEVTKAGWNRLAAPGHADTMATTMLAIDTMPKRPIAPYGVGTASVKVALDLLRRYAG